ncbi:MAG: sulfite exporter TauE/SafE family protein [Ignavibacteria bacterium]
MTLELFLILLGLGAAAGILAGYFGVGGGIIIVPSLIAVYSHINFQSEYTVHIAIATSLFTIIFTTISSAFKHSKYNNIVWNAALTIGITSSVTVFLFSKVAVGLPGGTLKIIFSVILIMIVLKMLFEKREKISSDNNPAGYLGYNKIVCSLIGIFSGFTAAFSGLGGGVIVNPLMHYLLKFPIKKSIGTSSAAILLTSISGVLGYFINMPEKLNSIPYSFGMVDTYSALPIIIASVPFSQLGVHLNEKSDSKLLKKIFAFFVLAVCVRMLLF